MCIYLRVDHSFSNMFSSLNCLKLIFSRWEINLGKINLIIINFFQKWSVIKHFSVSTLIISENLQIFTLRWYCDYAGYSYILFDQIDAYGRFDTKTQKIVYCGLNGFKSNKNLESRGFSQRHHEVKNVAIGCNVQCGYEASSISCQLQIERPL